MIRCATNQAAPILCTDARSSTRIVRVLSGAAAKSSSAVPGIRAEDAAGRAPDHLRVSRADLITTLTNHPHDLYQFYDNPKTTFLHKMRKNRL